MKTFLTSITFLLFLNGCATGTGTCITVKDTNFCVTNTTKITK